MKTELILSCEEVNKIVFALDRADSQGADDLQVHIELEIDTKRKTVSIDGILIYGTTTTEYLERIK